MSSEPEYAPEAPLGASDDLPKTGGQLGRDPEHFRVSEVPLYEATGTGDHLYLFVEKRGMTTPELVGVLARAARVRERDIGHAGLKDKHAITEQWLSLPASAGDPEGWELPEGVKILAASRHANKLRTGHLKGNHFCITLTDVPENGLSRARSILERLVTRGLYNYFGEQRFGRGGSNVERAMRWLDQSGGKNRKKERFYSKLYPSVLQSEVFNRYLTRRNARGLSTLIQGEVVRLSGTGSHFVVDDPGAEQPRLDAADLVLTGPMFGPKAKAASGDALALELEALSALGLGDAQLARLARFAPGTRRDLVVPVEQASVTSPREGTLELQFFLPAGSYATQLIREFTGSPWCQERSDAAGALPGADQLG